MGLSPHLGFWGTWVESTTFLGGSCGFESISFFFFFFGGGGVGVTPHLCFLGVGRFFLTLFCLGGGFTLIS